MLRQNLAGLSLTMQAESDQKSRPVSVQLDTAFVNLGALVRYLQERAFIGRVHVVLEEYEAELFFEEAGASPRVRETNHATARQSEGPDALPRLLVRAREPGGLINVYEGREAAAAHSQTDEAGQRAGEATAETGPLTAEEAEWRDLLQLSGEVIAAVERAALSARADFAALFRAARLELADDFSFLDPSTRGFDYARATVRLQSRPTMKAYVAGLSECLRRVVEQIVKGERGARVRERVALELAVLARRRHSQLARFKLAQQFDRIAGTRVL